MGLLGQMTVRLGMDSSGFASGLGGAQSALAKFASGAASVNPVLGILTIAAGAAIAFGVSSVKAAGDFQQSMLKIQAYAGLSKQQTDAMSASVLKMSTIVGQSPTVLADALYPIVSSGYSASQALQILQLSAESAAASGAQTSVVADALTTSLKAMHAPASDATMYMDDLNKTVALGKGQLSDYAGVIGRVALSAGSANVPFQVMDAALATLTTHGFPSVRQAATSLANLFTEMGVKTASVEAAAKKLKISFDANAFSTMSFSDKMAYLNKITDGNQASLLKLLSGSTAALKAFDALQGSTADFSANLKALNSAQGTTAQVFATASEGYNFQLNRMGAAFQTLQVAVGLKLLPLLTQFVGTAITPMIAAFANVVSGATPVSGVFAKIGSYLSSIVAPAIQIAQQYIAGLSTYFHIIVTTVESNLLPALKNLFTTIYPLIVQFVQWIATARVIPIIFQVLGAEVVIVIDILSILVNVVIAVIKALISTVNGIIAFVGMIKAAWSAFPGWWTNLWNTIGTFFTNIWNDIKTFFVGMWNDLVSFVQSSANQMLQAVEAPFIDIGNLFVWLYNHNTYIKDLVDAITKFFKACVTDTQAALTFWVNWIAAKFNFLVNVGKIAFALFSAVIQQGIQNAVNYVMTGMNTAYNFVAGKFSAMGNSAGRGVGAIGNAFSGLWSVVSGPLNSFWSSLVGWFNGLVAWAASIGASIINAVGAGISGAAGSVGSAIHGAISSALSGLGFHGIPGFASGTNFAPGGLAWVGENGPELVNLPAGSKVYNNMQASSMMSSGGGGSGSSHSGGEQTIYIMLDGDLLASATGNKAMQTIRVKHARRAA